MDARLQWYTGAALVAWSFWGFFSAVAGRHLPALNAFAWQCVAIAVCALLVVPFCGLSLPLVQIGLSLTGGAGFAQGSFWMLNSIAAGGPGSVVIMVTSMYPVAVLMLNMIFLQHRLSLVQGGGVVIAAASILCFVNAEDDSSEVRSGPEATLWWLWLCMLSVLAYAVWVFNGELCFDLQSSESLPSSAQGSRLIWQAIGCSLTCLLHQPSLRLHQPVVGSFPSPSGRLGRVIIASSELTISLFGSEDEVPVGDGACVELSIGIWSAWCMGFSMAAGALVFWLAVESAPPPAVTAIVMITGMYGAGAALLMRIFMNEQLSVRRIFGMGLALVAVHLLA